MSQSCALRPRSTFVCTNILKSVTTMLSAVRAQVICRMAGPRSSGSGTAVRLILMMEKNWCFAAAPTQERRLTCFDELSMPR